VAGRRGWNEADSASKRAIIEEGAQALGLPTGHTAFVGDWSQDIRSARAAGCGMTVGVLSSGFRRGILEAEEPDAILESAAYLPVLLASLRDMIGPGYIALDREGRWLNDGAEITHARTIELFWKSLIRNEQGRYVVRMGKEECPVLLHATPYFVRRVEIGPGAVRLGLSDGSEETLDPETLHVVEGTYLQCRVKGGAHEARFNRNAYYEMARHIREAPGGRGYQLQLGDRAYPIRIA
jgi:hypothetical protein